jgi:alpha-ketoglutarate-dependent 2,4-dichlorophenoxyacetate dioxygenase
MIVKPLTPLFGAEVSGINLCAPLSSEQINHLIQIIDEFAVVVFPDQPLTDDQHVAFAESLGPLEKEAAVVSVEQQRLAHSQMIDISNLDVDGAILTADDRRRMFNLGNQLWHSDSSFKTIPALYSMLHARVIPPEGGDTQFADMRNAWDRLPEAMQTQIESYVCDHSLIYSRALLGFDAFTDKEMVAFTPQPQRLTRRHPGSKRKCLFLSSHIGVVHDLPRPEGMMLIRELIEHATEKEFIYTHKWKVNDLVLWDNRCTMHRARPFNDQKYKRDMRRMTLADSASTLDQLV